jgi:uncharacterized protein YdgA (DUF945 family)
VKKSLIALLVVVALIVLISPGIVGRMAERSMDENLDWAAEESQELVVTSQGFDRGWFSSAGRHRVEVRGGQFGNMLLVAAGATDTEDLPALIIDTRLDHGLVPVTSMARDNGTLVPGLGSAVSTLSVELPDGAVVPLPGTIYSSIGLTGELASNYVLEPGSRSAEEMTVSWGAVDIDMTTNPSNGAVSFEGLLDSFDMVDNVDSVRLGKIEFSGRQRPGPFGFAVGDINIATQKLAFESAKLGGSQSLGPLTFESTSSVTGERVTARAQLDLEGVHTPELGEVALQFDLTLRDVDGQAVGNITRTLEGVDPGARPDQLFALLEDDLQRLLALGMELRFDRFDVALPQGPVTSQMRFVVAATDPARFNWTSVLLALDAAADLRVPAELVELAVAMNPQANAVIGMGFLRKNGDFYDMQARYKKGLLTLNGAPMPIPLPGVR